MELMVEIGLLYTEKLSDFMASYVDLQTIPTFRKCKTRAKFLTLEFVCVKNFYHSYKAVLVPVKSLLLMSQILSILDLVQVNSNISK